MLMLGGLGAIFCCFAAARCCKIAEQFLAYRYTFKNPLGFSREQSCPGFELAQLMHVSRITSTRSSTSLIGSVGCGGGGNIISTGSPGCGFVFGCGCGGPLERPPPTY